MKKYGDYRLRYLPAIGMKPGSIAQIVRIVTDEHPNLESLFDNQVSKVSQNLETVWENAFKNMFDIAADLAFKLFDKELTVENFNEFKKDTIYNLATFIIGNTYDKYRNTADINISELTTVCIHIATIIDEMNVYQFVGNFDGKDIIENPNQLSMPEILDEIENNSQRMNLIRERAEQINREYCQSELYATELNGNDLEQIF